MIYEIDDISENDLWAAICANMYDQWFRAPDVHEWPDSPRRSAVAWMPIDTAPMDGTLVLLAGGRTDENDYRNEIGDKVHRPVVGWCEDCGCGDKRWRIAMYDGFCSVCYENPTHWAKLEQDNGTD